LNGSRDSLDPPALLRKPLKEPARGFASFVFQPHQVFGMPLDPEDPAVLLLGLDALDGNGKRAKIILFTPGSRRYEVGEGDIGLARGLLHLLHE